MNSMNNRRKAGKPDISGMMSDPRLAGREKELEALASSDEGQAVKAMLGGEAGLASMMENGDVDGLRGALQQIVQTEAGAELMRKLSEMMK